MFFLSSTEKYFYIEKLAHFLKMKPPKSLLCRLKYPMLEEIATILRNF